MCPSLLFLSLLFCLRSENPNPKQNVCYIHVLNTQQACFRTSAVWRSALTEDVRRTGHSHLSLACWSLLKPVVWGQFEVSWPSHAWGRTCDSECLWVESVSQQVKWRYLDQFKKKQAKNLLSKPQETIWGRLHLLVQCSCMVPWSQPTYWTHKIQIKNNSVR